MKKQITLLTFFVSAFSLSAISQTNIPNANMESWDNLGTYMEPTSWNTPNPFTGGFGFYPCTQSTDANSGSYASRLQAYSLGIIVPGGMGTGNIDFTSQSFKGGFPISGINPAAVIGYYKYTPVSNDSCLVFAVLTNWDASSGKRDTDAVAVFKGGAAASYTQFTAAFFPLAGNTPDSALVLVSTAKDLTTAQAGSVMYVDDIGFSGALGLYEIPLKKLEIYPGVADHSLFVTLPENFLSGNLIVTNTNGEVENQIVISAGGTITLNTSSLIIGDHFIYARNNEGKIVASSRFIVVH